MYHLYEIATGRLLSSCSTDDIFVADGNAVKSTDKTGIWNNQTLDFDPIPENTFISQEEFYRRVGLGKLQKIIVGAKTDTLLETFLEYIRGLQRIDMAGDDMVLGLSYLESSGTLTPEEVESIRNG